MTTPTIVPTGPGCASCITCFSCGVCPGPALGTGVALVSTSSLASS